MGKPMATSDWMRRLVPVAASSPPGDQNTSSVVTARIRRSVDSRTRSTRARLSGASYAMPLTWLGRYLDRRRAPPGRPLDPRMARPRPPDRGSGPCRPYQLWRTPSRHLGPRRIDNSLPVPGDGGRYAGIPTWGTDSVSRSDFVSLVVRLTASPSLFTVTWRVLTDLAEPRRTSGRPPKTSIDFV
jgi:hypothetical protein